MFAGTETRFFSPCGEGDGEPLPDREFSVIISKQDDMTCNLMKKVMEVFHVDETLDTLFLINVDMTTLKIVR